MKNAIEIVDEVLLSLDEASQADLNPDLNLITADTDLHDADHDLDLNLDLNADNIDIQDAYYSQNVDSNVENAVFSHIVGFEREETIGWSEMVEEMEREDGRYEEEEKVKGGSGMDSAANLAILSLFSANFGTS